MYKRLCSAEIYSKMITIQYRFESSRKMRRRGISCG